MAELTDLNSADIRMGVMARFYERFWSEPFLMLAVVGMVALAANLLAAIRDPVKATHSGMLAFIVLAVFAAMSFHRRRIMQLLRERNVDRRVLGEMASVVFSLAMLAFIGTILR
jgi:uncharacterized membrane protein